MKKGIRKTSLLLLVFVLAFGTFLAACGGDEEENETTNEQTETENGTEETNNDETTDEGNMDSDLAEDQTLRLNLGEEPPTLDPALATDNSSGSVISNVLEGLTVLDKDGEPQNAMASDIQISDDKKTYTFTIREGATWTNGDPVTANDFAYAWKRVLDPSFPSDYASQLYPILNAQAVKAGEMSIDELGITVIDESTLEVKLENPTAYFLELTAFYTFLPVNEKAVSENGDVWANWTDDEGQFYVTNGPFKVASWDHQNKIILEKNDTYWDADSVKLQTVEMLMIADENTELTMFETGQLDWAGAPYSAIPTDVLPFKRDEGVLNTIPQVGIYWYKFNTSQPPFDNAKMRKAFAYTINRQMIVDNVSQGLQTPALGVLPETMELKAGGYFKDNDIETAKTLFNEALAEMNITADELPPITLSYNTSEGHKKIAEAIQDQWKQALGVDVSLQNTEWKVYLEDINNGNFQVARLGWIGDFNDPVTFLDLYKELGGNNDTRWYNEEYTTALANAAEEPDEAKRNEFLMQAEQILMDEMPIAPIYFSTQNWLQQPTVKGASLSALGSLKLKNVYKVNE
ncbi:peptide ABC transporter substrate-binding protein [Longirhabdus pacifica]|uniref:peptide ABC transporter substrate-binding protein n=1 Tax=Longirhabdus pacifica TaxID=2305227 RepID=UPI001F0B722E|nr:peptide ABC transporter substrate-binding protein [Longirhabdus pacifica]